MAPSSSRILLPVMALQWFIVPARLVAVIAKLAELSMQSKAIQAKRVLSPLVAVIFLVDRVVTIDKVKRPRVDGRLGFFQTIAAPDHGGSARRCSCASHWLESKAL